MERISDIDEVEIFVENLANIIHELKLSKSALNKKLGWPINKLSGILKKIQAPLIKDAKDVRLLLGINSTDLLTRILETEEIHTFSVRLNGLKLPNKAENKNNGANDGTMSTPMAYVIIVLNCNYSVSDEFTKRAIIELLPNEFSKYNIEWSKSRLKNYVEKVREEVNTENKNEHIFHLKQKLPKELVQQAITEVDDEWLKNVLKKKR